MTDAAMTTHKEPRWHWRNCRALSFTFSFRIWPIFSMGGYHLDHVYGGAMSAWIGPVGVRVEYDHGNCSAYGPDRWFALSECECWERACRFEGISEEEDFQ